MNAYCVLSTVLCARDTIVKIKTLCPHGAYMHVEEINKYGV